MMQVDVKRIISMGLGVRMAISSGKADAVVVRIFVHAHQHMTHHQVSALMLEFHS